MKPIPHGNRRYNWDSWCDGKWRKMRPGKDFDCTSISFRMQVLAKARELGLKADTRLLQGGQVAFCICAKVEAKNI